MSNEPLTVYVRGHTKCEWAASPSHPLPPPIVLLNNFGLLAFLSLGTQSSRARISLSRASPSIPADDVDILIQQQGRRDKDTQLNWLRSSKRHLNPALNANTGTQQSLMRHASVATTMNVYGKSSMATKKEANSKVVQMILPKQGSLGLVFRGSP
jgi:hypothetical protein